MRSRGYDELDVTNADNVTIIAALVKRSLGHMHASKLVDDVSDACDALGGNGGLHEPDRKGVKIATGY